MEIGTLQELSARPGDRVSDVDGFEADVVLHEGKICVQYDFWDKPRERNTHNGYRIISRAYDTPTFETRDDFIAAVKPRASVSPDHSFDPAPDTPRTWGEMTDAEKGALLLAAHEGKVIEQRINGTSGIGHWHKVSSITGPGFIYRIRPEPKRETVTGRLYVLDGSWPQSVPVKLVVEDGKPDCASIKMEEI